MKNRKVFLVLTLVFFMASCAGEGTKAEIKKLAEGVYQKSGWIYDMKELPSGKHVSPFDTVGKLATNVLSNSFTNPPSEMGITLYFVLNKTGENKNKITSAYLESTASDEKLFKFPRCLSICPISLEIFNADGSVETAKTTYSRPNMFRMDIEDTVLNSLVENQSKLRMRIPVSRNNQNTTFEWFDFDLTGFTPEL